MAEVGDKRKIIRTYEFMSALRSTLSTVCLTDTCKGPRIRERERKNDFSTRMLFKSSQKQKFTADHLAI